MYDCETPSAAWRSAAQLRHQILSSGAISKAWLKKSDRYGWTIVARILVPFFGLIGALPVAAGYSAWSCLPLALLLGLYSYKISFIMHDCAHDTLFGTTSLNARIGNFCGWLVGAEFSEYKRLHIDHHRFNGTDRDPQRDEFGRLDGASRLMVIWHLSNALAGGRIARYLRTYRTGAAAGLKPRIGLRPRNWVGIGLAQTAIALLATGFGRMPWLILLYPASGATVALLLARLRTFAEHVQPDGIVLPDFTRSHRPNLIDAFLLYDAHFNFHLEHHLFPHVPSLHLPAIFATQGSIHTDLTLSASMIGTIWARIREARR